MVALSEEHMKQFVKIGHYTINLDRIEYVETTEEFGTVVHFSSGETLQLGEESSHTFWHEFEESIGKRPNWSGT